MYFPDGHLAQNFEQLAADATHPYDQQLELAQLDGIVEYFPHPGWQFSIHAIK